MSVAAAAAESNRDTPSCRARPLEATVADAASGLGQTEPVVAEAQRRWAARSIPERLMPFREARHWIAANPEVFTSAIDQRLTRVEADTVATELLPLLDAMRFLERNAADLLAPRRLGRKHRPVWLAGVQAEIHREPLGHILVIGPANFPLFLPGVQAVQALVAGNAVTWKPGAGGQAVALAFADALRQAGLPRGVLHVAEDSVEAATNALAQLPDKVVFTGSYATGCRILRTLADTATPAVMELSGADAVAVLPSADLALAAKAIAFGLRLNGAEVCMSPRRVIGTRASLRELQPLLLAELRRVPPAPISAPTARTVQALLADALAAGATVMGADLPAKAELQPGLFRPLVLDHVTPAMEITRTDLFAPVLSLIEAPTVLHIPELVNDNPYGLTAAIFGAPAEADALAAQLRVGTVVINDLIAPTADPRVPFGGRGRSGFGLTRGGEGLLEMTAAKTILRRRKGLSRHYDPLGAGDLPMFAGLTGLLHGGSVRVRWQSLRKLIAAARTRSKTK